MTSGRRVRWAAGVLVVLAGCSPKPAPEPVLIGQLVSLTGADRSVGQSARQGAQLAVEVVADRRAAGRPVQLLHVDDRGDAADVQAQAVRLLTVNKAVALLAGFDAPRTEKLLRAGQPYGAPVVVPGELPESALAKGVVVLGAPPAERGRALARYASGDLGAARAAVLTDSHSPVAAELAAAFVKAWPRGDKATVEEWSYGGPSEHAELAERVNKARPDVVLLAGAVRDFRKLRSQLQAKGLKGVLYGGEDAGPDALASELEAGPKVYLATAFTRDKLTEAGRDFARRYEERFHEAPDLYAAQSYDGCRLLLDAISRAQATAPGPLEEELARRDSFETVTGPMSWKDRRPRRAVFLVAVEDNRARLLKSFEPEGP